MFSWILLQRMFPKPDNSYSKLTSQSSQKYWTLAVDAALKAKALESARGARSKWVRRKLNTKIPSRTKLGVVTTEQQICKDGMHRATVQTDALQANDCSQLSLEKFVQR